MAVLFSAAAAYLGLKVGQVFEAAIPIAIIAVGLSSAFKRKNALGENIIIQSIGSSSGVIVAGAIFTLPALYILQDKYPEITVNFMEVFFSSLLGGALGILLLIPSVIGIAKTRVNYDLLSYLPDTLETVKGQDVMVDEFGTGAFAMCVIDGMPMKDVQKMAEPVLAHRLVLSPEARMRNMTAERILANVMGSVQVPVKVK
jgi:hypothetical protein